MPGRNFAVRVNNLDTDQHFPQRLSAQRSKYRAVGCPYPPNQQEKAVVDRAQADCHLLLNSGVNVAGGARKANGSSDPRSNQVRDDPVDGKGREPDPESHVLRACVRGREGPAAVGAEFRVGRDRGSTAATPQVRRRCGSPRLGGSVGAIETELALRAEVQCAKGRYATPAAGVAFAPIDHHPAASAVGYVVGRDGRPRSLRLLGIARRAGDGTTAISAIPVAGLDQGSAVPAKGCSRVNIWFSGHFSRCSGDEIRC